MPLVSTAEPVYRAKILKAASSVGVLGGGALSGPRIMAALCDPEIPAREISSLIAREPALCARVLRVANSAFYGNARSISTLERALVLLGLDAVRGIAAAACLDRAMPKRETSALLDVAALVQHSHATAVAAQSLAQIRHPELASEAFIGGLLHNLGIVVQMQFDPPAVQAIIDRRRCDDHRDVRTLEAELSTVGHEDCLAVVFEAWNLPEALIGAACHHHDPIAAPDRHRKLASLINLGSHLSLTTGNTFTLEPMPAPRNEPAMERLALNDDELAHVALRLPHEVASLTQALG